MRNSKQTLKLSFTLVFSLASFIACTDDSKQIKTQEVQMPETSETTITTTTIRLPDMELSIEKFGENGIRNNQPLSASEQQQLQVAEIDKPLYQDDVSDFKYYLLKELYKGKEGKVLLISRTAEMEAFAWLATYDTEDKLVDYQTVYYDEWAESAVNTTSVISNDSITLRQYKMDLGTGKETTRTKIFQIGSDLKFKEVQP